MELAFECLGRSRLKRALMAARRFVAGFEQLGSVTRRRARANPRPPNGSARTTREPSEERGPPMNFQHEQSLRTAGASGGMGRAPAPRRSPLSAADIMTAAEVAEFLHVSRSTVEDWARRGIIPSKKVGRRRLYIRSKIEALLLEDHARSVV